MAFRVKNIFITGGNRGLGLGMTKAMLTQFQPEHLFVTYRNANNSQELLEMATQNGNLHPIKFEVTDYDKLPEVVKEVEMVTKGAGINLLINNAGILEGYGIGIREITRAEILKHAEVDTIAPIMITQAFVPLLEKASAASANEPEGIRRAAIVNISSELASIGGNVSGDGFSYRVAKAALNMATKCISLELRGTGITSILLHPGWVKTDMGSQQAPLTIEDSVTQMLSTLKSVTAEHNGKFLHYTGRELPW